MSDKPAVPYSAPFTTDVPQCCGDPATCSDPCVTAPAAADDLLKRLRAAGDDYTIEWGSGDLYDLAADELACLRADNERLTHLADKFKWQVRDTCTRAERAEAKADAALTLLRRCDDFLNGPTPWTLGTVDALGADVAALVKGETPC